MASFQSTPPKSTQENDSQFPSPPGDSISSIAVNGSKQTPSTILVSGSWDNAVNCYEISYGNAMGGATSVTNIVPRSQMKHDAPVLSVALNTVSYGYTGLVKSREHI